MASVPYPFTAVVGMDDMRLSLLLNAVSPGIGGVLVRGEKGTAKSTLVRSLAALLPGHPYLPGPVDQDLLVEAERQLGRSLRGHAVLRRALRDGFWQHLQSRF